MENKKEAPKCANCYDTGCNPGGKFYDCAEKGCSAASERAALDEWFSAQPLYADPADYCWAIHQRARHQEREACAARLAELNSHHDRHVEQLKAKEAGTDSMLTVAINERNTLLAKVEQLKAEVEALRHNARLNGEG